MNIYLAIIITGLTLYLLTRVGHFIHTTWQQMENEQEVRYE